jgi:sulfate permease, SulP family
VTWRSSVRAAWSTARTRLPTRRTIRADLFAAVPCAMAGVPDGMAASVLVGVSPVHGLYASTAGPIAGGLTTSTELMLVTTTSAAALAAGSALAGTSSEDRPGALTALTLMAGALMIVAAALRAGRYTRFVSHSVMTGFLTGVAANIILGQIPNLLGVSASGSFNLAKAINAFSHPGQIEIASLLTGAFAAALIIVLRRTPLKSVAAIVALVLPTIVVIVAGADSVARVRDAGAIPSGLPIPALPAWSDFSFDTLSGALAVMAIVLVQGAGVAQSAPNEGGAPSNSNRDFAAQGIANVAAGLVQGQPVGGSVGQTALNVASGARTRWAGIFCGLCMLVILLVFSDVIGLIAQPTLAGLLIVAGIGAIRPQQIATILRTGRISQVAFTSTLIATLLLPVAAAVGVGVALSLILQLNRDVLDLRIVELIPTADGRLREQPASRLLPDRRVTLLDIYGSLLYAGARTLQVRLPDPSGTTRAAVIIRLRGRTELGATFFNVVNDYAQRLEDHGGRLYLSGLDPDLMKQFTRAGGEAANRITALSATDIIGESSAAAFERASNWIATG